MWMRLSSVKVTSSLLYQTRAKFATRAQQLKAGSTSEPLQDRFAKPNTPVKPKKKKSSSAPLPHIPDEQLQDLRLRLTSEVTDQRTPAVPDRVRTSLSSKVLTRCLDDTRSVEELLHLYQELRDSPAKINPLQITAAVQRLGMLCSEVEWDSYKQSLAGILLADFEENCRRLPCSLMTSAMRSIAHIPNSTLSLNTCCAVLLNNQDAYFLSMEMHDLANVSLALAQARMFHHPLVEVVLSHFKEMKGHDSELPESYSALAKSFVIFNCRDKEFWKLLTKRYLQPKVVNAAQPSHLVVLVQALIHSIELPEVEAEDESSFYEAALVSVVSVLLKQIRLCEKHHIFMISELCVSTGCLHNHPWFMDHNRGVLKLLSLTVPFRQLTASGEQCSTMLVAMAAVVGDLDECEDEEFKSICLDAVRNLTGRLMQLYDVDPSLVKGEVISAALNAVNELNVEHSAFCSFFSKFDEKVEGERLVSE